MTVGWRVVGWYKGTPRKSSTISDGVVLTSRKLAMAYGMANMSRFDLRRIENPTSADYHLTLDPPSDAIIAALLRQ